MSKPIKSGILEHRFWNKNYGRTLLFPSCMGKEKLNTVNEDAVEDVDDEDGLLALEDGGEE